MQDLCRTGRIRCSHYGGEGMRARGIYRKRGPHGKIKLDD